MICLTLDLNSPDNFDIETMKISFRRLRQSYANDRRLVCIFQQSINSSVLHSQTYATKTVSK